MASPHEVTANDWILGITYSILASIVGGASKLSIRKAWLIDADRKRKEVSITLNSALNTAFDVDYHNHHNEDQNENRQQIHGYGGCGGFGATMNEISMMANHEMKHRKNGYVVPRQNSQSDDDDDDNNGSSANQIDDMTMQYTNVAPLELSQGSGTARPSLSPLALRDSFSVGGESDGGYFDPLSSPANFSAINNSNNKHSSQQSQHSRSKKMQWRKPTDIQKMKAVSWSLYLSGMIGMTFLNPLFCVLAMKYANPSILAPFSGLTLVWVVLFSGWFVGEHPGRSQQVACALIVLGEVLVAVFGDHTNDEGRSADDVISSYKDPAFHLFIMFMVTWLASLTLAIWFVPKPSLMRKIAWGSLGGSITGFQNFLKDALTILDSSKSNNEGAGDSNSSSGGDGVPAVFYLFVLLAMLTAFTGLLCLAACMKRFDATYSSSMFVVSFVLSASLMSSVHYHTFQHLEGVQNFIMYPMGLIVLFIGASILIRPCSCLSSHGDDSIEAHDSDSSTDSNGRRKDYRENLLVA